MLSIVNVQNIWTRHILLLARAEGQLLERLRAKNLRRSTTAVALPDIVSEPAGSYEHTASGDAEGSQT